MSFRTCKNCNALYLYSELNCPHCPGIQIKSKISLALLMGLSLSACEEKSEPDIQALYGDAMIDSDGDGYDEETDCDDQDALTYPGAAEIDSTEECMRDLDDDGYGDSQPDNSNVIAGTDCDDSDPSINPGEENCN
jgi:hypothetical protein